MKTSPSMPEFASRGRTIIPIICAGLSFMMPIQAQARGGTQGEVRLAECIRQAADGHPWLEKTLWGLRDQEGGWIGAQVRNTNGSHDLGPLQINSWWVPKLSALVGRSQVEVRTWLTSDPCFNAGAARWIFLSALRTTGDFWKAVGVYHSPTAWRQRRYALSVARHMQRRFGRGLFVRPVARDQASANVPLKPAQDERRATDPKVQYHGFGTVSGGSS
ncbi:lytic transglycosylase domain-containing protein [Sphingobium fluviale]|jgi:hypothetical protein|uniref:lytic transglycosylase domain-containing protein n=1 Tax=Sphingobium fluviale TaxID=2506423 RepID=UPI0026A7144B